MNTDRRNLDALVRKVFTVNATEITETSVIGLITQISKARKNFSVQQEANDLAQQISAELRALYGFAPNEGLAAQGHHVAALLVGARVPVVNPVCLTKEEMVQYVSLLASIYFQDSDQIRNYRPAGAVIGGGPREIEVSVKVDTDLFDTFKTDYDNRVLYGKASRLELVNKVINIILQSDINLNNVSYEQCSYIVDMFEIFKLIISSLKSETFSDNSDFLIKEQILKVREIVERGVRLGYLSVEMETLISKEIDHSEERVKLAEVPEQDKKWLETMKREFELREEIFDEIVRKITIVNNMITLRFVSREMVLRDRQFYQDYENRVHAINAYLYADLVEYANKELKQSVDPQFKVIFEQKCKHFLVFMNCVKQIDLAIQLCAQKEIQAPERLRVAEIGKAREVRSTTSFKDELAFLQNSQTIDDADNRLDVLIKKNIDSHIKHISRLQEIFEIFLDIVNQIVDDSARQKFELVLGSKVNAEDLAKIFDQFLVSMSIVVTPSRTAGLENSAVPSKTFKIKSLEDYLGVYPENEVIKHVNTLYQDALTSVFNFVVLHCGRFKDIVYHQSNTPASVVKKIYLGGSIEDAKEITTQQLMRTVESDFDFVYDAIQYHVFISQVLKLSEINVTNLTNLTVKQDKDTVKPDTFVNVFFGYASEQFDYNQSLRLACLVSQKFPEAEKTKKIIEFIRLVQDEINVAGFIRETSASDMFSIEALNKNPFVTDSSFPTNMEIGKIRQINEVTMTKYERYNSLVNNLTNQIVAKVSGVQYEDLQRLANYKDHLETEITKQAPEKKLTFFQQKLKENLFTEPTYAQNFVTYLIDFYNSLSGDLGKPINLDQTLKAFDPINMISEQAFQQNMRTTVRGLIVLLQKGLSKRDTDIRKSISDIKAEKIESITLEKQNIHRRHLINSYILQSVVTDYPQLISTEIGEVFAVYAGRPIQPIMCQINSFADIVLQRAVLMSYCYKNDYLKRTFDSVKQKIIDSLKN